MNDDRPMGGPVPAPPSPRGRARYAAWGAAALAAGAFLYWLNLPGPSLLQRTEDEYMVGDLKLLRGVVSTYFGDTEGRYPGELSELTKKGKYLPKIPRTRTAFHRHSAKVRRLSPGAPTDEGGWGYDSQTGTVFINCTHTDTRRKVLAQY